MARVNQAQLQEQGYTVVKNVLTTQDCDKYVDIYQEWLSQFHGQWPRSAHSLIQRHKIGHMEPSWGVRLKSKKIFDEIWGTEDLLTSFDAVSIGRPPEEGVEDFAVEGRHWLHCDQSPARVGLHAYQGGVYLEDADADDWTFEILQGSHHLHSEFFESNRKANIRSITNNHYSLRDDDVQWYLAHEHVVRKRIPVPKGGMILWDSRLIHANARPIKGRQNPGRWRYVVFVCMAPISWASREYLKTKGEAYKDMKMTSHWPCDGLATFSDPEPEGSIKVIDELPEIARSDTAKRLAGVLPYKGQTITSLWRPKWAGQQDKSKVRKYMVTILWCGVIVVLSATIVRAFIRR